MIVMSKRFRNKKGKRGEIQPESYYPKGKTHLVGYCKMVNISELGTGSKTLTLTLTSPQSQPKAATVQAGNARWVMGQWLTNQSRPVRLERYHWAPRILTGRNNDYGPQPRSQKSWIHVLRALAPCSL